MFTRSVVVSASLRAGRFRRQVPQRHRRLPLHAGVQQGPHHAGVPGTDDRVPAAALERLPKSHAGAAVLPAGSGGPLLPQGPRRRHALPDGPGLDSQGARSAWGHLQGADQRRKGTRGSQARGQRAQVPQREERHSHAGVRAGQHNCQRHQLIGASLCTWCKSLVPVVIKKKLKCVLYIRELANVRSFIE